MRDKELAPEEKDTIISEIKALLQQFVEHGISVNFVNDIRAIGPIGPRGLGDYTADIELGWSYIKIRDTLKSNLDAYLDSMPDKEKIELEKYYRDLKEQNNQYYTDKDLLGGILLKNPSQIRPYRY